MPHQVVIVGGGLAGLFTASELLAAGVDDVVVVDDDPTPGGVARTVIRNGYTLEPAAGTLMLPNPKLTPVLENIGVDVEPAVDAGLRYIYTGGRLVQIPPSPKALAARVAPWSAKLRAGLEPFIKTPPESDDETLDQFFRRRLGDGLGRTLAWVAASGVFAGDPSRLSALSTFPTFPALEDEAGSVVRGGIRRMRNRPAGSVRATAHVPVGGMAAIAAKAVERLGDRYRSGFHVETVRLEDSRWIVEGSERLAADQVVVASRPVAAASLLGGELQAVLSRATSAPAVVVGLGGESSRFPLPEGFGALMGPDAGTATLGVLFESSYAPSRAPEGHSLVKVIAGGATRPHVVDWDDETIVHEIGREVSQILGVAVEASFVEVVRHREGVPQYNVGHREWLIEIEALVAGLPGLHLTGWGYRGIGVAHLAADATSTARRVVGE